MYKVFNSTDLLCAISQKSLRHNKYVVSGDEDVFKRLHSHFTWMLKAGALTYSETLYTSDELLKKLNPRTVKNSIFEENACSIPSIDQDMSLRALENLLSKNVFRILLYCTLTGIHVSICYHVFFSLTIPLVLVGIVTASRGHFLRDYQTSTLSHSNRAENIKQERASVSQIKFLQTIFIFI